MNIISKLKFKYSSHYLSLLTYFLVANTAFAQLVPCGSPGQAKCTLCDLLVLIKNLTTFMTQLGLAFAGLFFAWGAFVIMTAGGSEQRVSEGRKVVTTTVVGILIMFSAYLIIGTLLNVLTGSPSALPWTQIQCTI
jgi:hypothetical protein